MQWLEREQTKHWVFLSQNIKAQTQFQRLTRSSCTNIRFYISKTVSANTIVLHHWTSLLDVESLKGEKPIEAFLRLKHIKLVVF